MKKRIKRGFVLQQDQADCGIACLLSVIRFYNGDVSFERLRELSGTDKMGTSLLGLYQAAKTVGFNAKGCEADVSILKEYCTPIILHIQKEKFEHYVVFYKYENEKFVVGDPAEGIQYYDQNQLEKLWITHRCLVIEPNDSFQETSQINSNKLKWFNHLLQEDVNILISSIIIGLILAALGMATAIFSQKLIDTLIPSKDINKLILATFFLLFLLIIRSILQYLRGKLVVRQNMNFSNRIVGYFYDSLLALPKRFFDGREVGDMVARISDTSRIQRTISQIVGNLFIDLLMVVVGFVVIFYYSWEIATITAIFIPFNFIIIVSQNKKILEKQKKVMIGYARTESNYIDTIKGVSDVKCNNQQQSFGERGRRIYDDYQSKVFSLGNFQISLGLFYSIVGILFTCSVLAIGGYLVIEEKLLLGEFMASFGLVTTIIPSVLNLALMPISLSEARIAFDRMYELSSVTPENNSDEKNLSEFKSLCFNKVSFRFPGRKLLFRDISFSVNKGEVIAIIGESGCGKSTIGQLIERFYFTDEGSISINEGLALDSITLAKWREIVGYVPQFPHIFNGTVAENILFDVTPVTYKKLVEFLNESGLYRFFNELPLGLETLVGEKGINLSGGQIHLLSLVRILIKEPKILVMDEVTSAMDRNTERFILDLLISMKPKVAIIFITHRLHTLKTFADRIYIIENGGIEKCVTHIELLKYDNFYSQYWNDINIHHMNN